MWRYLAGGLAALLLIAAGVMIFRSPARSDPPLRAAPLALAQGSDEPLPETVPEASPKTREQKRFDRYDKDRNAQITRDEYLLSRRKAYARLDTNRDGNLSFDEWSAKTVLKFTTADKDKSGTMNPTEFATTALKRKAPAKVKCPPVQASGDQEES